MPWLGALMGLSFVLLLSVPLIPGSNRLLRAPKVYSWSLLGGTGIGSTAGHDRRAAVGPVHVARCLPSVPQAGIDCAVARHRVGHMSVRRAMVDHRPLS